MPELNVELPGYAAVVTSDTIVICKDEKVYTRELSQSAALFSQLRDAIQSYAPYREVRTILSAYGPK